MAIAIQLFDAYDIEDYSGLQAYLIAKLELDAETSAQLPTFIRLAEYRLDRELTFAQRESTTTLTTTAGDKTVPLPVDLRVVKSVKTGNTTLTQKPLGKLEEIYANQTGSARHYHVGNQFLTIAPTPGSAESLELTYVTRLPPLSDGNPTNWLLSNNADVYVYATAARIADWLEDLDAANRFDNLATAIINEIKEQASEYRHAAPLTPNVGCVP